MSKNNQMEIALWILAGIGAGTVIGATIGLVFGPKSSRNSTGQSIGNVEDLNISAHQLLGELSDNVSTLLARSKDLLDETRSSDARHS